MDRVIDSTDCQWRLNLCQMEITAVHRSIWPPSHFCSSEFVSLKSCELWLWWNFWLLLLLDSWLCLVHLAVSSRSIQFSTNSLKLLYFCLKISTKVSPVGVKCEPCGRIVFTWGLDPFYLIDDVSVFSFPSEVEHSNSIGLYQLHRDLTRPPMLPQYDYLTDLLWCIKTSYVNSNFRPT